MIIQFATKNKHKAEEVEQILSEFGIEVKQLEIEKIEPRGETIENISKNAAELIANQVKLPIILEDTGLFFEDYNNFPGPLPKFVFQGISYKGIFKLLEGTSRKAYFKTVAAYCEPGKEPVLFEGIMKGKIINKVINKDKDIMPYDKIFIPEGHDKTISEMELTFKNTFSQRGKAFRKFGEWFVNGKT